MKALKQKMFLALTFGFSFTLDADARPLCSISEDKKQLIYSVLCGQAAPESEYRFSGANCASNSIKRRMDDSAIQVVGYSLCGDKYFSQQLQDGNIRASSFMQILSVCTPEKIDIYDIFENSLREARLQANRFACTSDLRQRLEQRRPYFATMIEQSKSPILIETIFGRLGIKVDAQGNISER